MWAGFSDWCGLGSVIWGVADLWGTLSGVGSSFFCPRDLSAVGFPVGGGSPVGAVLGAEGVGRMLRQTPPFSSPLLVQDGRLYGRSPTVGGAGGLNVGSPRSAGRGLSPFPVEGIGTATGGGARTCYGSFLFRFVIMVFGMLFAGVLGLVGCPLSGPCGGSMSLRVLLTFVYRCGDG